MCHGFRGKESLTVTLIYLETAFTVTRAPFIRLHCIMYGNHSHEVFLMQYNIIFNENVHGGTSQLPQLDRQKPTNAAAKM